MAGLTAAWVTSGGRGQRQPCPVYPNGRPCSLRCSLQLRADVVGNQVEEEVGGEASWASMFGLCSPRVRLRLPDQGEQP